MKSFFTKLGGLLLCGVMFIAVGCHDYSEDIQDGDKAVLEQIDAAKADLAKQVADVKTTIEGLDKKYEALGNVEKAVAALKTELETEISEAIAGANAEISSLKAALADKASKGELTTLESNLKAKLSDEVKALESKITAATTAMTELLKSYATTQYVDEAIKDFVTDAELAEALKAYATADDFQALFEMIYGEDGMYETLEGKIQALETAVEDLAAAEDLEIVEGKVSDLEETVKTLVDDLAALKESVKANTDAVAELKDKVSTIETTLAEKADKTALESLEASIKDLLDAKVDQSAYDEAAEQLKKVLAEKADKETVNKAIEDFKAALATKVEQAAFDKALETVKTNVAELQSTMDANDAKLQASIDEVKGELTTLVNNYKSEMEDVYANIKNLMAELERLNKVEVSIAELQQLFARIQSVVYKPTHADGKARVQYAKAGEEYLEGYSYITYKVYPAKDAETIVNACSNTENPLTLEFDVEKVEATRSGAELLKVEGVAKGDKDGEIVVKYSSNLGAEFFKGEASYSAALVLSYDVQNFSTEYTNFTAGEFDEYQLVLYYLPEGATEKTEKVALAHKDEVTYSWPYVASDKRSAKTMLAGLEPRFQKVGSNDKALDVEAFEALGYSADYKMVAFIEDEAKGIENSGVMPDGFVEFCPASEPTEDFIGDSASATYVCTWNGLEATARGIVKVIDFEYELAVTGPDFVYYYISYVDKTTKHILLDDEKAKLAFGFKYVGSEEGFEDMTVEEMADLYPAVKIVSGWALGEVACFNIVPFSETYKFPATVSLKDDVDGDDVGKMLTLTYNFSAPLLSDSKSKRTALVKIDPPTYNYTLDDTTINWNYMEHAASDADKTVPYVSEVANVIVNAPEVTDDVEFSKVWIATNNIEYTVEGATVKITPVEGDNTKANVKFEGFEWGKTYPVKARVEVINANGKTAAVVNTTFNITTVDRNRDAVFTHALKDESYDLVANLVIGGETISDDIVAEELFGELFPEVNRGAEFDAAEWLKDVFVNNPYTVKNTLEFNDKTVEVSAQNNNNSLIINTVDGNKVYTRFHYASENFKGTMPTELIYKKYITTYYGQEIELSKKLSFVLPEYVVKSSDFYVKDVDGVPQSFVEGTYTMTGNKVSGFAVNNINMNDAFFLYKDNTPMTKEEIAAASLDFVFSLETEGITDVVLPIIDKNVITYNSPLDQVGVSYSLDLVNTVDGAEWSRVALAPTSDKDYSGYVVNKYDPLLDIKSVEPIVITLNGTGLYSVNLAEYLNLDDKVGRKFIIDGEVNDDAYIYNDNYYGLELDFDTDVEVPFELANSISVVEATAGTQVVGCVVSFNYSTELQIQKGFEIVVPVSYKYTWGETSTEITVRFVLPENN